MFYINDTLYSNHSTKVLEANTNKALSLYHSLGFTVNAEKSSLTPSRQIVRLGLFLDTTAYTVSLPAKKLTKSKKNESTFYNLIALP